MKEGNSGNNCTDANPIKDQQVFMDLFRSGLRLPSGSFPKSNELFKNSDGIPIDFLKDSKCIKQMTADFCFNSPRTLQELCCHLLAHKKIPNT